MVFLFLFPLLLAFTCGYFISEILILGCGRQIQQIDPELGRFIRSTGMKLEAIDSVTCFVYGNWMLFMLYVFLLLVKTLQNKWLLNEQNVSAIINMSSYQAKIG